MSFSPLPDADRSALHPWGRLVAGVAYAQRGKRRAWSTGLAETDAPVATAENVAAGWLTAQPGYARAKGYLTAEQFARLRSATSPKTVDAWLTTLAALPAQQRADVIQAPAKRQLYWYLLPLATALRDGRAVDLSLPRVNAPTWGRPRADLPSGDLDWFSTAEGLIDATATIVLLETDPYLRQGSAGSGRRVASSADQFLVVRDKEELFDVVHATAFAGYIEPVVTQYRAALAEHGINSSRSALYASGLFGLAYPPFAEYQAQVMSLSQQPTDVPFCPRAQHACRVGEFAADQTADVVVYLGQRPGYRGLISTLPVHATTDPEITGEFPTRVCCRAHGGRPDEPVEQALECAYCGLNNPVRESGTAAGERRERLRHRLEGRGLTITDPKDSHHAGVGGDVGRGGLGRGGGAGRRRRA